jgi:pyrroloquinoline quinone biosynthesis protein A
VIQAGFMYEECDCAGAGTTSYTLFFVEDGGANMQWTTPSYTDIRLGFEITMYIATR